MPVPEQSAVVEKGNIYFLYVPKVESAGEEKEVKSLDDVQRVYVILAPEGTNRYRRLVIGRKKLPKIREHERYWGFVDAVGTRPEEVERDLREEKYETATRGERKREAARPAAEGVYQLVRSGRETYLAYKLELPEQPGEVQAEMNIAKDARYVISVKNPERPAPPGVGLPGGEKAELTKRDQEKFRGRRFIPADPDLLNQEGAEFVLIGAGGKPEEELGVDLEAEDEDERSADILKDLRLNAKEHPLEPLFEGEWK